MKKIIILFMLCQAISVVAQDFAFDKVIYSKGKSFTNPKEIEFDKNGNMYLFGEFDEETILEGKQIKAQNKTDVFLAKYDNNGNKTWTKHIGGIGHVIAHSLIVDTDGNILISGAFGKTCSFDDKEIKATDYQDNFLAKYSADGSLIWVKAIKANTKSYKTLLASNQLGQVFFAGSFLKYLEINEQKIKAESNADIFIAQVEADGKLSNPLHIKGKQKELLSDILVTEDGTLYLTGSFSNTIHFNVKTLQSNGEEDIFLACYQNNEFKWAKSAGSALNDYATQLLLRGDKLLLGGSFSGKIDFEGEELTSAGALDAFVNSYTPDGQLNWAKSFGSYANECLNTIAFNKRGQIYLSGNFRGKINKDTSKIESKGLINDVFLAKYTDVGDFVWARNFGGKGTEYANKLVCTPENYLYLMGSFEKKVEFGTLEVKAEGSNFFVAKFYDCDFSKNIVIGDKMSSCSNSQVLKAMDGFVSYQWSTGEKEQQITVTKSGSYSVTATDVIGCEATSDVDVTLHPVPVINKPGTQYLCKGASLKLDAGAQYENYLWNTGSKNRKLTVYEAGQYNVDVLNEYGCKAKITFSVQEVDAVKTGLLNNYQVVEGDKLMLEPTSGFVSYVWSNQSEQKDLTINTSDMEPGNYEYSLELTDNYNCSYTHNLKVEVLKNQETVQNTEPLIVKVNPNPSDGKFELKIVNIQKDGKPEIMIFTLGGTFVEQIDAEKTINKLFQKQVNLTSLPKGTYLLNITVGQQNISKEIIIQ